MKKAFNSGPSLGDQRAPLYNRILRGIPESRARAGIEVGLSDLFYEDIEFPYAKRILQSV
jgi:hypothetical protein